MFLRSLAVPIRLSIHVQCSGFPTLPVSGSYRLYTRAREPESRKPALNVPSNHCHSPADSPPPRQEPPAVQSSKRQKSKKRVERKYCGPPILATSQSPSPLEVFFATYAPQFQYNTKQSASLEFYRLCKEFGWDKEAKEEDPRRKAQRKAQRKKVHQKFKNALVQQFNIIYGMDVDDLKAWQNLCRILGIDPIPDNLHACREAVYYTFVNLVDLVDTWTTGEKVQVFESECALSEYTIKTGKYFPKDHPLAGGLLRYLLRRILHPRSGYDTSRGRGRKGRKRRR